MARHPEIPLITLITLIPRFFRQRLSIIPELPWKISLSRVICVQWGNHTGVLDSLDSLMARVVYLEGTCLYYKVSLFMGHMLYYGDVLI